MVTTPAFDPNRTEGIIAIAFIVLSFVLLVILLTTCIVCCCWRYKLHKRKNELKAKDAAQGIVTKRKSAGCCRCCGCWLYCCRCCRGCCESKPAQEDMVVVDVPPVPRAEPFGWSKDVYVYNNSGPPAIGMGGGGGGCGGGCSSQPVNFNSRWSTGNDGRLLLNAGGIASKYQVPGAASYGAGIYPTIPAASNNQFVLTRK